MTPSRVLVAIVATISAASSAACGEPTDSRPLQASPAQTDELPAPRSSAVGVTDPVSSDVPSTVPALAEESIHTQLGTVTYILPAGAGDEVLPVPNLPTFVLAVDQWLVADCCHLKVVLQDVRPLYPADQQVSETSQNGLHWIVYDVGPQDGSQIAAIATIDGLSVTVGAQSLFAGNESNTSPLSVVNSVIATVAVSETDGGA